MNREDTRKAIKVMRAYVNGAEMEYKHPYGKKWVQLSRGGDLSWDWSSVKYRIKLQPREFWLFPVSNGELRVGRAHQHIDDFANVIKVREVIE